MFRFVRQGFRVFVYASCGVQGACLNVLRVSRLAHMERPQSSPTVRRRLLLNFASTPILTIIMVRGSTLKLISTPNYQMPFPPFPHTPYTCLSFLTPPIPVRHSCAPGAAGADVAAAMAAAAAAKAEANFEAWEGFRVSGFGFRV